MSLPPSLATLERGPSPASRPSVHRAWWWPVILAVGLLSLVLYVFRDRLVRGHPVQSGRVVAIAAARPSGAEAAAEGPVAESAASGVVLFQASGWVEASPAPVHATAMINGVIRSVEVREGEMVEAGQVLATLVDDDTRLALDTARAGLDEAKAEEDAAAAEITAAENRLRARRAAVTSVQASLEETRDLSGRFEKLPEGAVPAAERVAARLAMARAEAAVAEQQAMVTEAESDILRRQRMLEVARTRRGMAAVAVAEAELAQSRTRVLSPVAGRVQRLPAAPGQRKRIDGDDPDSATIAVLYQPGALQTRVDVPLAEAGRLTIGQPARIRSNLLPDQVVSGSVAMIGGQADRTRNTLAAVVTLEQPDPRLRPDTLCRVEFLAGNRPSEDKTANDPSMGSGAPVVSLFVPEAALPDAGAESLVWVIDPENRVVARRAVTLAGGRREGFREVAWGLRAGEWVVLHPDDRLRDGLRVALPSVP